MKDIFFYIFITVLVVICLGAIPTKSTDSKVSTVCSLKGEAYTFDFNALKRNKELDLLCLCKGT